ncbi:MAG: hypothetical protein Q4E50_03070 [Tissierellia bacterium]|nr:hypothetical protein [Tissierellia bacterium]
MKKRIWLYVLLAILLSGGLYYAYNLIRLNRVDSKEFSMEIKVSDSLKHMGVFDGVFYGLEGNKLRGVDKDKGLVFEKHLGLGINDIVYDKFIYVSQEDGLIRAFDRFDGTLFAKLDLGEKVYNLDLVDKKLLAYGRDKVFVMDMYLKDMTVESFDYRPVKYEFSDHDQALIFLDRELGGLKSRFEIYREGKKTYYISSVDELFMYTSFLSDKSNVLLTNSYLYLINNGKLIRKTFILNPRAIDVKNDKIALVDDESLKIFDKDLKLLEEVNLSFKADNIMIVRDKILLVGNNFMASYEDNNLIKTDVANMKSYFLEKDGIYVVMPNRIEKVKAY